ncbi:hypothetical protein LTR02_007267 [Friedmanniomyces endolithicus]|nr:hypothetical protein LTR94_006397 [Friedmanniomyces endolithicus]KAK0801194.1 hypothetical protein LTR59_005487 [Friedmanniomyces endolithicus]KAK0808202.1 hypothetical protein LTR38_004667 [Friedmanniomyces endolithicus]KAK0809109.1 hypothetical protein LTR75_006052 [Friedmanniomyces endolithicus]KAK0847951.1 hypothetical protein LTR03_006077 [Friedmanniomyces endolithicus]
MSTALFRVTEHTIPTSHIREYPRSTADDQEDVLSLAVKQYTPKESFRAQNEVTVIGGHANGFPKELYEPLWDELYERLKAKGIRIRSIWVADVAHQGASGVLNERKLGNDPSWLDHPRDLFLMVNHFRKEMKRPLIGIGHSMGGNNLVNLSIMHPRLFTTLILIDPVIQRQLSKQGNYAPAHASSRRRDRWPNRQTAEASFRRSKFYQTWDPRVLDLWIKYGLRDLPTYIYPDAKPAPTLLPVLTADPSTATIPPTPSSEQEVTLTTTKHQEVLTFLRQTPSPTQTQPPQTTHADFDPEAYPDMSFYSPALIPTFLKLPLLRPSVFYIYGDLSTLSAPHLAADRRAQTGIGLGGPGGVKAGRVGEVTFEGVGHLIPMEVVGRTAEACAGWLAPELERWGVGEQVERAEWGAVGRERRAMMSEGFLEAMERELGAKKAKL